MEKYFRKPLPVEAVQYNGSEEHAREIQTWVSRYGGSSIYRTGYTDSNYDGVLKVPNRIEIEKAGTAKPGDWIVCFGDDRGHHSGYFQVMNDENFKRRFTKKL